MVQCIYCGAMGCNLSKYLFISVCRSILYEQRVGISSGISLFTKVTLVNVYVDLVVFTCIACYS